MIIRILLLLYVVSGTSIADELKDALADYRQASRQYAGQGKTADETNRFHDDWLSRLSDIALANSNSPHYAPALGQMVGLANSVGRFELSQRFIDMLLKVRPNDPKWEIRWRIEAGSVAMLDHRANAKNTSRLLAVKELNRVVTLIESIDLHSKGANRALAQDMVKSLAWLGRMHAVSPQESQEAADSFAKSRKILEESGISSDSDLAGITAESLARNEMLASIGSNNRPQALKALQFLTQSSEKWPASYYVRLFASEQWPGKGREYSDFLAEWQSKIESDSGTAILLFHLAESYFNQSKMDKARKIFLQLEEGFATELLEKDSEQLLKGRGGYFSVVLYRLSELLGESQIDDAIRICRRFIELFPRDDAKPIVVMRLEHLLKKQAMLNALATPGASGEQKSSHKFFLGNVLVVLFVGCMFVARRMKARTHSLDSP